MMRLPPFRYLPAASLEEATQLLADHADAQAVSGGTDLYPKMKRRQLQPKVLVGLRGVEELRGIHVNGEVAIGAGLRLHELASAASVLERYPALARAASLVASPQIRNAGTVGGNLCVDTRCNYYDLPYDRRCAHGFCLKAEGDICRLAPGGDRCWAVSSTDLAPVACVLRASVRLVSARGERTLPVAELYTVDDGMDYLTKARDEVVAQLVLPPADGLRATYVKFRRRGSIDFPLIGVAAAVRVDDGGACTEARLVLGAVAPSPLRVSAAEEVLVGNRLAEAAILEAAQAAARVAKPMDAVDLPPSYRKKMIATCVARAFRELAGPPS
jgi:4-hydroxybenzoyl-CoA reductase subunit beta